FIVVGRAVLLFPRNVHFSAGARLFGVFEFIVLIIASSPCLTRTRASREIAPELVGVFEFIVLVFSPWRFRQQVFFTLCHTGTRAGREIGPMRNDVFCRVQWILET
ncbi:hypothetical protein LINPERHAP1_LOCUS10572, partial [Linum perenne]